MQNRVGPVKWLKPYTDEKIKELAKEGIESLLAVPISFVSEHIETLEEIDMDYRELALESGIKNWGPLLVVNQHSLLTWQMQLLKPLHMWVPWLVLLLNINRCAFEPLIYRDIPSCGPEEVQSLVYKHSNVKAKPKQCKKGKKKFR